MRMHLKTEDIEEFRKVKEQTNDSWRFVFRVYKRMKLRKQDYETAKRDILAASKRREQQLALNAQRILDKKERGFSEIKKENLDLLSGKNEKELAKTPIDVESIDDRTTRYCRTFILCMRYGYDVWEFGTEGEIFFSYDGVSIKSRRYRQDPVGYHESISDWIENSRSCSFDDFPNYSKVYDLNVDLEFIKVFMNYVEDSPRLAYDYREDVEILLDFVNKGYSARNVGFDSETLYGFVSDEDGSRFFRVEKSEEDYDDMVVEILRCPVPRKFNEILELFVENFGLEMDPFIEVYNYLTSLNGGGSVSVRFFPGFYEVSYSEKLNLYQRMNFYIRDFLKDYILREVSKNDAFRMVAFETTIESFVVSAEPDDENTNVEMSLDGCFGPNRFVNQMLSCQSDYHGDRLNDTYFSSRVHGDGARISIIVLFRYSELGSFSVGVPRKNKRNRRDKLRRKHV